MKLASAQAGQVVRNATNGSHYRFDCLERSKARIRPMELFPTGLLIPKPTDTLVQPDLEVVLIGAWHEDMTVEGKPSHSQVAYEVELAQRREAIVLLEAAYEELPQNGKGKLSRGSWANKIKNCKSRITTLERGLGLDDGGPVTTPQHVQVAAIVPDYSSGDLVQVPSGRPALVLATTITAGAAYAQVRTAFEGRALEAPVPCEVLRPWSEARLATI